jgi:hypothetical protein
MTSKPARVNGAGMSLAGIPLIGQAVSGMEAARVRSAASTRNVGRQVLVLPPGLKTGWVGERERVARRKSRGVEY